MQKVADERDDIRKTAAAIRNFTGRQPRGWLGPGLTETWETPDLVAEEGFDYVCDWVLDDEPVWLKTRTRPIVNLPYTQECNDVAMMLIQHHKASEYYDRAIDQFAQLYADAARSGASWRWWYTLTSWGRRTGSDIFATRSPISATMARCCSGPAKISSTGTWRSAVPGEARLAVSVEPGEHSHPLLDDDDMVSFP